MSEAIELYKEWKVPLSKTSYKTVASLASLFDLMFYHDKDNLLRPRYYTPSSNLSYKSIGLQLDHNIIVFDENMYRKPIEDEEKRRYIDKSFNETDEEKISFEHWAKAGFDICLPNFDRKSKPFAFNTSNFREYLNLYNYELPHLGEAINTELLTPTRFNNLLNLFNIIRRDGDIINPTNNNPPLSFRIWNKKAVLKPLNTYDFYKNSVLYGFDSTAAHLNNTWADYSGDWFLGSDEDDPTPEDADIIITGKDIYFEEKFLNPEEKISSYNGICLNYKSKKVWYNLIKYYGTTSFQGLNALFNSFIEDDNALGFRITAYSNGGFYIDPILEFLLRNCYVWIRYAAFADYIDYKDFDQKLNRKSDVIHRNMMLTRKGDFNRYDSTFSETTGLIPEIDFARNTRPYFPITTPSVDILKNTLLPTHNEEEFEKELNLIINDAVKPNTKIGALPIEPLTPIMLTHGDGNYATSQIPNSTGGLDPLYPPPIWFDPDSRREAKDYNDFPILVPKKGNLITDGRLISPTIDELWIIIKKLIAGRLPDTDDKLDENILGYPRGREPERQDPPDTLSTKTNFDTTLKIKQHKIYKDLLRINENIPGQVMEYDVSYKPKKGDPVEIEYALSEENELTFRVKSWINDPEWIEFKISPELLSFDERISEETDDGAYWRIEAIKRPDGNAYKPDENPKSLRELESYIKGLRWNFEHFINYISNIVTFNNVIFKNDPIINYDTSDGGLHQLHRDYVSINSDGSRLKTPDTHYNEIRLEEIKNEMISYDKEKTPSWAVYMGANGAWHSSSQAILMPIRQEDW